MYIHTYLVTGGRRQVQGVRLGPHRWSQLGERGIGLRHTAGTLNGKSKITKPTQPPRIKMTAKLCEKSCRIRAGKNCWLGAKRVTGDDSSRGCNSWQQYNHLFLC